MDLFRHPKPSRIYLQASLIISTIPALNTRDPFQFLTVWSPTLAAEGNLPARRADALTIPLQVITNLFLPPVPPTCWSGPRSPDLKELYLH